jgi:hypothetical protein
MWLSASYIGRFAGAYAIRFLPLAECLQQSDEEPIKAPTSSPAQGRSFCGKETEAVGQDSRIGSLLFGIFLSSFFRFAGMFLASGGTLFGKLGASFNSAKNVP